MDAAKIPLRQRILLYDGTRSAWRSVARAYLKRWAGQLPDGGVLTATGGLASGCCGHYSFWKRTLTRHEHPGERPVPADLQAALRGEASIPGWFREGRSPEADAAKRVTLTRQDLTEGE